MHFHQWTEGLKDVLQTRLHPRQVRRLPNSAPNLEVPSPPGANYMLIF